MSKLNEKVEEIGRGFLAIEGAIAQLQADFSSASRRAARASAEAAREMERIEEIARAANELAQALRKTKRMSDAVRDGKRIPKDEAHEASRSAVLALDRWRRHAAAQIGIDTTRSKA